MSSRPSNPTMQRHKRQIQTLTLHSAGHCSWRETLRKTWLLRQGMVRNHPRLHSWRHAGGHPGGHTWWHPRRHAWRHAGGHPGRYHSRGVMDPDKVHLFFARQNEATSRHASTAMAASKTTDCCCHSEVVNQEIRRSKDGVKGLLFTTGGK